MTCPALDCNEPLEAGAPFCAAHWAKLDPYLQGELTAADPATGGSQLRFDTFTDCAVAHLAWLEDRMTSDESTEWLLAQGRARHAAQPRRT